MHHPVSFWFASLDVKAQKGETIIDMGDERFLLGQLQMQFGGQEAFNRLFGFLYLRVGFNIMTDGLWQRGR